jgi:hypothetical protein
MEPFPLMKTRQPVDASTCFRELPLGPKTRPTKLNWDRREYNKKIAQALFGVNQENLHKLEEAYIWIGVNWDFQT